jgi:hypothetical protein
MLVTVQNHFALAYVGALWTSGRGGLARTIAL